LDVVVKRKKLLPFWKSNPGPPAHNLNCHLVQNVLSSHFLSKKLKIKIYKTLILPVVLYGHETLCLTLRGEHRWRVFEEIWAYKWKKWH
jgi:hypothetical protein